MMLHKEAMEKSLIRGVYGIYPDKRTDKDNGG